MTAFLWLGGRSSSFVPVRPQGPKKPRERNEHEHHLAKVSERHVHFDIAAKQDKAYQNFYANNKDALMQLLITVDNGEAKTHTVTVGEDTVTPSQRTPTLSPPPPRSKPSQCSSRSTREQLILPAGSL